MPILPSPRRVIPALLLVTLAAAPSLAQSRDSRPSTPPSKIRDESPAKRTGPKIDLRPRFTKGQTIKFKMAMTNSGKQVVSTPTTPGTLTPTTPPTETTQNMSQEIGLTLKVKDTNKETGSTLDLIYDSFKISMKGPDGSDITFDCNGKNSDDPMSGLLAPLVGLTLELKMDKDGNITSVTTGEGGEAGDIASLLGGASGMKSLTSADVVKNLFGPIMTTRKGAGEAHVGESWTNEDLIDAPWGKMKLSTTQTLSSARGSVATIDLKGKFDLQPSSGTSPAPNIRDSLYVGKTLWNTQLGMLDEMTMTQRLVVEPSQGSKSVNEMNVKVTRVK